MSWVRLRGKYGGQAGASGPGVGLLARRFVLFHFFFDESLPGVTVMVGAGMIMVLLPFSFEASGGGASDSAALFLSLATFDPFFHFPGTPE
jgi:hypothetical protein